MKTKRPTCPVCTVEIHGPSIFCPHCGGNQEQLLAHFLAVQEKARIAKELEEKRISDEQSNMQAIRKSEVDDPIQKNSNSEKKSSNKKPLIAVGALAILGVGLILTTSNPSNMQPTSPNVAQEKITVNYSEIADQTATYNAATSNCDALGKAILFPDFLPRPAEQIGTELDRIASNSAASKYLENNGAWMRESLISQFEEYLRDITNPSLRALITEFGYGSDEYEVDFDQWSALFNEYAVAECDLDAEIVETESNIIQFQKDVDRVNALAN